MKPPKSRRSLQEIHKLRQQENFIGREMQEDLFAHNLTLAEEQRVFIFNIFGIGGVGKTSLLFRFKRYAESPGTIVVWNDEMQKDVLTTMDNISKHLEKQNHEIKKFNKSYNIYKQRCQELLADPNAPEGIADFVSGLAKAGIRFGQHTPANLLLGLIDEELLVKEAGNLTSAIITHMKHKLSDEEMQFVQNPIEKLTPLFIEDLWEASQDQTITFFFDTYEYTSEYLDDWLLQCLNGHYGNMPANIILTIAGQNELDKNKWKAYDEMLARIAIEPFTEEEARLYLARKGLFDEATIQLIIKVSQRLPLLIATLASQRPRETTQVGSIGDTAIDCFLKWVKDAKQRVIAVDAALPRYIDRDVLAAILGEQEALLNFDWLKKMPFLRASQNGWLYHDTMRSLMIHHKRTETPREWADLHSRLVEYYKNSKSSWR